MTGKANSTRGSINRFTEVESTYRLALLSDNRSLAQFLYNANGNTNGNANGNTNGNANGNTNGNTKCV